MMSGLGLNLPNLISLGRLLLVPLAISLILDGEYWAAFWVFVVAGISDALDGFIAKRFDRRTRLGALLDPLADKVLLVSVYVTLGVAGQIWAWLVVLVVFRDIMIIGGFLLIQALAARQISSRELVDASITRIEAFDPKINAVVVRDFVGRASLPMPPTLRWAVASAALCSGCP